MGFDDGCTHGASLLSRELRCHWGQGCILKAALALMCASAMS